MSHGPQPAVRQIVVGTAGHIDHGKSALVRALTGVDPDRLPEEQARGMTIDLGFAHLRAGACDIWLVDVPGHERFIRNMVAGATGIDVALLAVAADDSVMPQTREHVEVLSLLGVRRCVVALTKCDLTDDAWIDEVEREVAGLLAEAGLAAEAVVRTSVVSGRGIEALKQALVDAAWPAAERAPGWFLMPIDRAFGIAGRGTVVTGSVVHGGVENGAELELWPAGRTVRVRDLQTHGEELLAARGRMRLALNLAGVALEEVGRGCTLATPGYMAPSRCLEARVTLLRAAGRSGSVRRMRLRLHLATSDVQCELRLLEAAAALPARDLWTQLIPSEPLVAAPGQCFVLRDAGGSRTLGGGEIVRPVARPWSRAAPPRVEGLRVLCEGASDARLLEVLLSDGWRCASPESLAARAGLVDAGAALGLLDDLRQTGQVVRLSAAPPAFVHGELVQRVANLLRGRVDEYVSAHPRSAGLPHAEWVAWMPRACPARFRGALAEALLSVAGLEHVSGCVRARGRAQALHEADAARLAEIPAEFEQAGCQPPAEAALRCRTAGNAGRVRQLVQYAVQTGALVRIGEGVLLHAVCWERAVERLRGALAGRRSLTVAEIRDLLGTTRKFAVPICEHLDGSGLTRRSGDQRFAGPRLNA